MTTDHLAPLSRATLRQYGYALSSLPLAIAGFVWTVTLLSFGAGTVVTVLGLPVLALLLVGARGFGAVERGRVRRLLGDDLPGPDPVVQRQPGVWGAVTARLADPAGWKAALYLVVMFPWSILSFVLTVVFGLVGWVCALYPCYAWVFPRYVGWRGYRLFEYTGADGVHHVYELSSLWQIAATSLIGIALVFLTPLLVRGLTGVSRGAARGLLGR
ncbi:hypothetical protein P3T36_006798 [Kitasatospora sp. MAP12-15]|uniref:sensor domain-containing protein n=1 Tax=unclassified Kitasatospora TaxID=2633591 RepID=UPI002475963F|nr:sensor domain-containing protein [Kitasatospora sp. MAP12-44]MDH6112176.1 hypothetical protein [Kitasatospora sp. MAP12-44]